MIRSNGSVSDEITTLTDLAWLYSTKKRLKSLPKVNDGS